ncbi:MAG: Trk system potassium transporter TrkA [Verrucomicrobiota bacterium]
MKIVISGLGEVGSHLGELLIARGHELVLIDADEMHASRLESQLDAVVIAGSATSVSVLRQAGVGECEFFLSLTSQDEVNLVASSLAKALGAKNVIARCHAKLQREYKRFSYGAHFGIDDFVSPERLVAARLAKEIRSPITPVLDQFARGEIEVLRLSVDEDSPVAGKGLRDIKFPPRMRVGLIGKDKDFTIPNAETVLEAGADVILVGAPEALKNAAVMIHKSDARKRRRLAIYGADDVGVGLLEYFNPVEADIKLIEPDENKCKMVSELYPWVKVLHGHATRSRLMREENLIEADVFVAATRDDEDNVMSCLQAAKLGIKPILLTIHRPDYAGIFLDFGDFLGVTSTVSPRVVTAEELLPFITTESFVRLWHIRNEAEIIQIRLNAKESEVFGKKIYELKWPTGVLLLGIERADGTIVPTADDEILSGDSLLIINLVKDRENVLNLFESAM